MNLGRRCIGDRLFNSCLDGNHREGQCIDDGLQGFRGLCSLAVATWFTVQLPCELAMRSGLQTARTWIALFTCCRISHCAFGPELRPYIDALCFDDLGACCAVVPSSLKGWPSALCNSVHFTNSSQPSGSEHKPLTVRRLLAGGWTLFNCRVVDRHVRRM